MPEATRRDYAWAAFSIVMLVLLVGGVLDTLWRVILDAEWWRLVVLPVGVLFYWWLGMGAWRRTIWGHQLRPDEHIPEGQD